MRRKARAHFPLLLSGLHIAAFAALVSFTACDEDMETATAEDRIASEDGREHEDRMRQKFAELDKDGDGAISVEEAEGDRLAKKFDKVDKDGDGLVTPDEMSAMHRGRKGKHGHGKRGHHGDPAGHFAELDADGSGSVSLAEAGDSRMANHFAMIDADGDENVTSEEFDAFHEKMKDPAFRAETKMKHKDANGDGQLTIEEMGKPGHEQDEQDDRHAERHAERFAKMDADGDGAVTLAELTAHEEAHRKGKGKGKGRKHGGPKHGDEEKAAE